MIQGRAYWKSWDFDGPGKLGRGNVGNYTRRDSLNETVFNGRAIAMGISGRGSEQMTAWPRVRVNFASLLLTNKNLQIPECNRTILSFFLSPNSSPYACPRVFPSSYLPTNAKLCFHQHQARNVMRQMENIRLCFSSLLHSLLGRMLN